MFVKLACAALHGVDAFKVDLEVDLFRKGLPAFSMVGLAEASVRESKERVFSALKNCGHKIPPSRITVNLAPADRKKQGSAYDLPLALGLLAAAGIVAPEKLDGFFVSGELSLAGEARPVPGVLSMAILAKNEGARGVIVPAGAAAEAAAVKGLTVYAVNNLGEALAALAGDFPAYSQAEYEQYLANCQSAELFGAESQMDFAEVKGQEHAKRAIEVAAAGGHNLLFVGPPGSGKTMLAQRIPSILPDLGFEEALEVSKVYSVAGLLQWGLCTKGRHAGLVATRPFRAPHHTISYAGLAGGGANPKPGEVSLAHRGVLFLDELPEFSRSVLEVLRQPLEGGEVNISRAGGSMNYPARFMLVAAMNPCPCGYLNDPAHACTCTGNQVQSYRARLSGPLLDRIDLHVEVPAVPYKELRTPLPGMSSKEMRQRIVKVRNLQVARYQAACDRGACDRGASDRGACDRGASDRGASSQVASSQAAFSQDENLQAENFQAASFQAENLQAASFQASLAKDENKGVEVELSAASHPASSPASHPASPLAYSPISSGVSSPISPDLSSPASSPISPAASSGASPSISGSAPDFAPASSPGSVPASAPDFAPDFAPTLSPSISPNISPSVSPSIWPNPQLGPQTAALSSGAEVMRVNGHLFNNMTNAGLSGRYLAEFCALGQTEHDFLEQAANALGLSARSCTRILRISRTIADLAGDEMIGVEHLAEAINFRFLDRPL